MDLASRFILTWNLTDNHRAESINTVLNQALNDQTAPEMVHTDQGSEYLSYNHHCPPHTASNRLTPHGFLIKIKPTKPFAIL